MAWVFGSPQPGQSEPSSSDNRTDIEARSDLHTQFEDLLNAVLAAEANWRFYDRLDLAARLWQTRPRESKDKDPR